METSKKLNLFNDFNSGPNCVETGFQTTHVKSKLLPFENLHELQRTCIAQAQRSNLFPNMQRWIRYAGK